MPYPTTLIVLAVVGSVTVLGWQGTIDGAAVTSIFGAIISGVLVGHYVKTTPANGAAAGTTTTTTTQPTGERTTTVETPPARAETL